ncbi:MAG: bifunctional glycosyltransferase family 2/GtrA family protein [Lachnospiraceae bacterium]|nr:bifunctional glycosyltransferase family 2/GtrA family protein [Lachnospiraceae bacterium]
MNNLIPIIIPSYEPDERLIDLLEDLVKREISPVIIVNDGSDEKYDEYFVRAKNIISSQGGVILKHDINRGKGKALKTAFSYCLENYPDMIGVITADSDGQHTPDCILKVKNSLIENPNSLILGVRDFDDKSVPRNSRLGNKITVKVFKFFTGLSISDTQTGLRGISKEFMNELLFVPGDRFEFETKMLVETKDKYDIEEVEIKTVYDSVENHTTHFDPFKDSIRIYKIFGAMFLKFLVSSLSSCVIDILLFAIFCQVNESLFSGVYDVFISAIEARVISATYNFLINYIFVFRSKESRTLAMVKYALLAAIQMFISATATAGLVYLTAESLEVVMKVIVDVTLFFISYYIQHEFVYRSRRKKA